MKVEVELDVEWVDRLVFNRLLGFYKEPYLSEDFRKHLGEVVSFFATPNERVEHNLKEISK